SPTLPAVLFIPSIRIIQVHILSFLCIAEAPPLAPTETRKRLKMIVAATSVNVAHHIILHRQLGKKTPFNLQATFRGRIPDQSGKCRVELCRDLVKRTKRFGLLVGRSGPVDE